MAPIPAPPSYPTVSAAIRRDVCGGRAQGPTLLRYDPFVSPVVDAPDASLFPPALRLKCNGRLPSRSIGAPIVADAAIRAHFALAHYSNVLYPGTPPDPCSHFGMQNDAAGAANVGSSTGLPAPGRTTLVRGVPSSTIKLTTAQ